jgi:hypothetical protein
MMSVNVCCTYMQHHEDTHIPSFIQSDLHAAHIQHGVWNGMWGETELSLRSFLSVPWSKQRIITLIISRMFPSTSLPINHNNYLQAQEKINLHKEYSLVELQQTAFTFLLLLLWFPSTLCVISYNDICMTAVHVASMTGWLSRTDGKGYDRNWSWTL